MTLQGGDLDGKITEYKKKGKSFDEKMVMDWIVQLTMALQYMHSRRVLHRDLKTRWVVTCTVHRDLQTAAALCILVRVSDLWSVKISLHQGSCDTCLLLVELRSVCVAALCILVRGSNLSSVKSTCVRTIRTLIFFWLNCVASVLLLSVSWSVVQIFQVLNQPVLGHLSSFGWTVLLLCCCSQYPGQGFKSLKC